MDQWKADEIWYVVGVPQQLHFRQIFDAAHRWGKKGEFRHIAFGSILDEDRNAGSGPIGAATQSEKQPL